MKFTFVLLSLVLANLACAQVPPGMKFDGSKNRMKPDVDAADRLVIRTCGLMPSEQKVSHVILEIKGNKEVQEFIKPFELFGPLEAASPCACNGDPTFEFYKGDTMVTQFSIKHGMGIFWPDAWPREMFPGSKVAVDNFLLRIANLGYPVYMHQKQLTLGMIAYIARLQQPVKLPAPPAKK